MRYLKDVGFVIKRFNIGEADRFVTIFTKNFGKIEVLAKGIRKINSRRAGHLELLSLIRFYAVKSSKNYILTEIENFIQTIDMDSKDFSHFFLMCELVGRLCPYNQKNERVFDLLYTSLTSLNHENQDKVIFDFQVKLLSILGFWDDKKRFFDVEDVRLFIEELIQGKIRSQVVFEF